MQRLELLRRHGIELPLLWGEPGAVQPDDLLDAGGVSRPAWRVATGCARSLPDPPQACGHLQAAIWY